MKRKLLIAFCILLAILSSCKKNADTSSTATKEVEKAIPVKEGVDSEVNIPSGEFLEESYEVESGTMMTETTYAIVPLPDIVIPEKEIPSCFFADSIEYTFDPVERTYTVSGSKRDITGPLFIPSEIDGYPVTRIGDEAFKDCTGLKGDVILPASVVSIGDYAFSGCTGLDGVLLLGEGLKQIGEGAFSDCVNLRGNVFLPSTLEVLGAKAFYGCTGLDGNLLIGEGLEEIGDRAFYGASGLKGDIVIPQSVKIIGDEAFAYCIGLGSSLVLTEGLEEIGERAFLECTGLKGDLLFPKSLKIIGNEAFKDCNNLDGFCLFQSDEVSYVPSSFEGTGLKFF